MDKHNEGRLWGWALAAGASAVLGLLGLFFRSFLAFPGFLLGAAAIGAVSRKGKGGPGERGFLGAIRIAAAAGMSLSLIVLLALIVNLTAR